MSKSPPLCCLAVIKALTLSPPGGTVMRVSWTGEDAAVWEERLRQGASSSVFNMLKKHLPQVRSARTNLPSPLSPAQLLPHPLISSLPAWPFQRLPFLLPIQTPPDPQRLAEALLVEASVDPERRLSELRKEEAGRLLSAVSQYQIPYTGHQGYAKAEVTGGGIPLSEINCSTMESKVGHRTHGESLGVCRGPPSPRYLRGGAG